MARLSLSLLGPMQVTLDDQPVTGFAYDKVRALLAYLAVEADRPHRREALLGLLWPDFPEPAARNNLRHALGILRHTLADEHADTPLLLASRETIQLNPAADLWLDTTAMTTLLDACERHPHRNMDRCVSCAQRLGQAIGLYRGAFLQEFCLPDCLGFDEWALAKREGLHQGVGEALARLASYHERRGAIDEALIYTRRLVELEPWHEAAQRHLMQLLWRSGDRGAALAQYERCRRILREEFGAEPEAETRALHERIHTGEQGAASRDELLGRDVARRTLPVQTTSFVGREGELAQLEALLENPANRLITVTGPGGIGKTRLALKGAERQRATFLDGVYFVPLASVNSPDLVIPALVVALQITLSGNQDPKAQLVAFLREKELLLVLDNFEHLRATGGLVAELLQAAPRLTVLVTSRVPLHLSGEQEFPVPPLEVPDARQLPPVTRLAEYSAFALFLHRAQAAKPDFQLTLANAHAVADICARLDGLPLAIELAAARSKVFAPAALRRRLEHRLEVLIGGPRDLHTRQQTLRATLDWSYRLLDPAEQSLFARLGVFVGGWTLNAAEAVCDGKRDPGVEVLEQMQSLLDKNLIRQTVGGDDEPRFSFYGVIHEYALERLNEARDPEAIRQRCAMYFLGMAESAEPRFTETADQAQMKQLQQDYDNLQSVLRWLLRPDASQDNLELGLRLTGALHWFWGTHGLVSEGRRWLEVALGRGKSLGQAQRAKALVAFSRLARLQDDYEPALAAGEEALALYHEISDKPGIAYQFQSLAMIRLDQGDGVEARRYFDESRRVYLDLKDMAGVAWALNGLGLVAVRSGDYDEAVGLYSESLCLFRQLQLQRGVAWSLTNFAYVARCQGDNARAHALYQESLEQWQQLNRRRGMSQCSIGLGLVALATSKFMEAAAYLRAGLTISRESGAKRDILDCLEGLAGVACGLGQRQRATILAGAAESGRQTLARHQLHQPATPQEYDQFIAVDTYPNDAICDMAWAKGRAMTLEQAIAYALEEVPDTYDWPQ